MKYEKINISANRLYESYFICHLFYLKHSIIFSTFDYLSLHVNKLEYPFHHSPSHFLIVSSDLSPQSSVPSQIHGSGIHLPFAH